VIAVIAIPLLAYLAVDQFDLPAMRIGPFTAPHLPSASRESSALILFDQNFWPSFIQNLFDMLAILVRQQDDWVWNSLPGFGLVYLISLPFAILGMIASVTRLAQALRKRIFDPVFILLAWLVAALILGMLIRVNINRWSLIIFPLVSFTCAGIYLFVERLPRLIYVFCATYLVLFALFSYQYFGQYNQIAGLAFNESLDQALAYSQQLPAEKIIITNQINGPGVLALAYLRYPTDQFLKTVQYTDSSEFEIRSFGKYIFGLPDQVDPHAPYVYIIRNDERGKFPDNEFRVQAFERFSVVSQMGFGSN
jgi:hypothetical protein